MFRRPPWIISLSKADPCSTLSAGPFPSVIESFRRAHLLLRHSFSIVNRAEWAIFFEFILVVKRFFFAFFFFFFFFIFFFLRLLERQTPLSFSFGCSLPLPLGFLPCSLFFFANFLPTGPGLFQDFCEHYSLPCSAPPQCGSVDCFPVRIRAIWSEPPFPRPFFVSG